MKVLVAYMSLSGNTKKIAEAIFQEIREGKEIKEITQVNSLEGFDFAFIGFPMHGFGAPEKAENFFEKHCTGKDIALFVTHGAPDDSSELQPWLLKCKEAAAGANVIDMFNCQGELAQYVIDELLKSDNPRYRAYGKAAPSTKGQPNAARVERARIFARSVMERITS